MDATSPTQVTWRLGVLPRNTKKALDYLAGQAWIMRDGWYLAGGTALALQAGHRSSVDLDFFTQQPTFDLPEILNALRRSAGWKPTVEKKSTLYGKLLGAKISFIAYPFFIPRKRPMRFGLVRVLQSEDIAVMKVIAVSQRGKRRDFIDLYWCVHNLEPLEQTIGRLKKQYPSLAHNLHHILKSLVFFDDAEGDPMPNLFFDASWPEIKIFFENEVTQIADRVMQLS